MNKRITTSRLVNLYTTLDETASLVINVQNLFLVSDNSGNSGRGSRRERQHRMEDDSTREEDRLTDDGEEPEGDNTRQSTHHQVSTSPAKR